MKKYLFILAIAGLFALRAAAQQPPVPLLTLNQLQQRMANGGDTTYVINFWATWCVPCLKELPAFEALHEKSKSELVKVLLVSVDVAPQRNRLATFVKKRGLKSEVWLLNEPDPQTFINRIDSTWSGAIPATLLVKKGTTRFFEKPFTLPELEAAYHNMH